MVSINIFINFVSDLNVKSMSWIEEQEKEAAEKFQQKFVNVVLAGPYDLVDLNSISLNTGCRIKNVKSGN